MSIFQACYIGFIGDNTPLLERPMSIVKMRSDRQHEDMGTGNIDDMCYPGTFIPREKYLEKPCKHGIYHSNKFITFLMSDEWEIKNV